MQSHFEYQNAQMHGSHIALQVTFSSLEIKFTNHYTGHFLIDCAKKQKRAQVDSGDTQQPLPKSSRALSARD